jgi:alpha-galactosidase
MCGFQKTAGYEGWYKAGQVPSANGTSVDITVNFADINLVGSVRVRDVWAQADAGVFTGSYTAKAVPFHGTALLRLTQL